MQSNKLFLTADAADKASYVAMMNATVQAVADAMDHPQAYAGMEPYALRAALRTDELLPENASSFETVLE